MGILDSFFNRKRDHDKKDKSEATKPQTRLWKYVAQLNVEHSPQNMYESMEDGNLKFASAIAVFALIVADDLFRSLNLMLRDPSTPTERITPKVLDKLTDSYDAFIFETSAYCHYFLRREYLHMSDIGDIENNKNKEKDSYYHSVTTSARFAEAMFSDLTDFKLKDNFYIHRSISYSLLSSDGSGIKNEPDQIKRVAMKFQQVLLEALVRGVPKTSEDTERWQNLEGEINLSMGWGFIANLAISDWHLTMLHGLRESTYRLFEYDTNRKKEQIINSRISRN